jgi:acyl carrier protein
MSAIEQELRKYVLENYLFNQKRALLNSDSFMEMGIIDSTGVLELVSYLEEKYAIEIDAEELIPENLDSIDHLTQFIQRKLAMRGYSSPLAREQEPAESNPVSARSNA